MIIKGEVQIVVKKTFSVNWHMFTYMNLNGHNQPLYGIDKNKYPDRCVYIPPLYTQVLCIFGSYMTNFKKVCMSKNPCIQKSSVYN